jgi:hypothetical protein
LPAKRLERAPAVVADEHERALAGPAAKADGAIEHDFEARHSHRLADYQAEPDQVRRWTARETAKKQQRDMQPVRLDRLAGKPVRAPQNAAEPVDFRSRIWVRKRTQVKPSILVET